MRRILGILVLVIGHSVFAESGDNGVTVHLNYGVVRGARTNLFFECSVTVSNKTGLSLTATNLFSETPGLALAVRGFYGQELARIYVSSVTSSNFTFSPSSSRTYKLLYRVKPTLIPRMFGPVSLRIEGILSGSGYTNNIVSNFILSEVK
jgi:hypothetical protein